MAYSFKQDDKSALDGMRRIAAAQSDAALMALSDPALTLDMKVYAVRRRIKKLRALIRLFRSAFPAYKKENAVLREAGRRLSDARDAAVMIETFDRQAILYAGHLPTDVVKVVRDNLLDNRRAISDAGIGIALLETEMDLRQFKDRLPDWELEREEGDTLSDGLAASFERAVRSLHHAVETRDAEDLHEWRKWTKYHWLQLRLLKRVWLEGIESRNCELDLLTDELGEHHDLYVLCELLRGQEDIADKAADFLASHASRRLSAIEGLAISRGEDLFVEDPHLFARRCAAYWEIWRKADSPLTIVAPA